MVGWGWDNHHGIPPPPGHWSRRLGPAAAWYKFEAKKNWFSSCFPIKIAIWGVIPIFRLFSDAQRDSTYQYDSIFDVFWYPVWLNSIWFFLAQKVVWLSKVGWQLCPFQYSVFSQLRLMHSRRALQPIWVSLIFFPPSGSHGFSGSHDDQPADGWWVAYCWTDPNIACHRCQSSAAKSTL